jgi:ATP-dependent helicase/DNAse subunit B
MGLLSDNHVYSYTQLSSFDECPYGFYMNYIEKAPDRLNNAFAEQGTLIHDLID